LIALIFILPLGVGNAQSPAAKPVEPTAIGIVYCLDPTSQELRKLPDEQWKGDESGSYGTHYIGVSGSQSSFRVKAGDAILFVFKTGSPEKVSLYSFEVKKNKRRFAFEKVDRHLKGSSIKGLPVEVSQYGEKSYKLVPASPLIPGEYAVIIAGEVYTFGIDQ